MNMRGSFLSSIFRSSLLSTVCESLPSPCILLAREIRYRFFVNHAEDRLRAEVEDLHKQWCAVMNASRDLLNELENVATGKHVLFMSGYGLGSHFLTIEPIIMMALKAHGCKLSSVYCSGSLPACEFNMVGNNEPPMPKNCLGGITGDAINYCCNKCTSNIRSMYELFPLELHGYGELLSEEDYREARELASKVPFNEFRKFIHNDIAVGEEVFASILRVTFKGTVEDTKENRLLVTRYLYSGILMAKSAENAYRLLKPDRVAMIHGVYLTHGISTKVATKLGIPVVIIGGGGIRKDTVVMCHGETYHHQLIKEPNSLWENNELSAADRDNVMSYTRKKRCAGGGADYLNYHPNPMEDSEQLLKDLQIDQSREIVSVYTNVIWDAQIFYEGNAFKDIFDWLFTTIELLGKNKNVWGVIRIHPAEKKGALPTRQPMKPEIRKHFPKLPSNIRIISPESDISSYTLGELSRAAIIYGTKMGLELALMKIPLIVCGETFSRNKGYGLDIISREQYEELLVGIHNYNPPTNESFERAIRYANYFYFRRMLDLPFTTDVSGKNGYEKRINLESLGDLLPGKNEAIDVICNGIIDLKPFHLKNNAEG